MFKGARERKDFFVGIDSDGTVFDSMTIKHCEAFIPTMIKVWGLEAYASEVAEINRYINLYSASRGVNRFPGLEMAFGLMKEQGIPTPEYGDLTGFINANVGLSNASLRDYAKEHPSVFLQEVLRWSEQADRIFAEKTEALMPFSCVRHVLAKLNEYADIVVISSASSASLNKDWERVGLDRCVTQILGQEAGSKKKQLVSSIAGQYVQDHILMIGDALGDYEAVQETGGLFYPIIPGREEESWEYLLEDSMKAFINGEYAGRYQEQLLEAFRSVLNAREK